MRVPDRFGTATFSSATHPGCDTVVGGDTVTLEAGGYLPGAEVVVALQIVEAEAAVVATVAASADGTVTVPVGLPNEPAGTIGGFEMIGDGPDGLLLNEALLLFEDPDACAAKA